MLFFDRKRGRDDNFEPSGEPSVGKRSVELHHKIEILDLGSRVIVLSMLRD